ncbi:unnamed protein product [Thelazia callipaeda]|uniref:Stromal cell-derived factor 2 n=1 Tax=Thelazia callipaeda TaxID=103827 RepID=A0A0N5CR14_THECL|nr:unnamed protein product [Thelazia callipaeda]
MLGEFGFFSIFYFVMRVVKTDEDIVACNSLVKLKNNKEDVRLHSHDVKYGTGSGQQSVTAVENGDDVNSYWLLLKTKGKCKRGEPISCGQTIRLKHHKTSCYLHSHLFDAPITRGNQEVSCYGKDEESDSGDHWKVLCDSEVWLHNVPVRLKHEDTGKFLGVSGQTFGRPISGQYEVVGTTSSQNSALWAAVEGVFMVRSDKSE